MQHLTTEELAAYVSAALHGEELSRVEAHLTQCDDCRGEVIEGRRAIAAASSLHRPSAAPFRLVFAGLAAAAVVVFAIWPSHERARVRTGRIVRGEATILSRASNIGIVTPNDGGRLEPSKSILIWRRDGDASTYRLTLTDESGAIVWTVNTPDTSALPPSPVLKRGGRFFWYVDALRADGHSITSGVHDFTVAQ